jgi:hypothetical protein
LASVNLNRLTVQVAGFGKTDTGASSRYMETVEMKIMPIRECESRIERLQGNPYLLYTNHLCGVANPFALMTDVRNI